MSMITVCHFQNPIIQKKYTKLQILWLNKDLSYVRM